MQAIYAHVGAPPPPEQGLLGFLLGNRYECPVTNVAYLVVDAALRLTQPISGGRTRDVVARLWDRLQAQLEVQHAHLIGWYRTHAPLPLELSPHDVETHETYFAEPWQVAMLLGTDPREPAGAFFRAGRETTWVRTPLPFYELLQDDSIRPEGKKRSFVTWKNYRAYNPVVPQTLRTAGAPTAPGAAAVEPPTPRARAAEPKESGELRSLSGAEDLPSAEPQRAPAAPQPEPPAPSAHPAERKYSGEPKVLNATEGLPPLPRSPPPPPPPKARPRDAKKRVLGAVAVEVAVLLAVVALVETTVVRVGLALAAALLLAYRAATVTSGATVGSDSEIPDRRQDQMVRDHVERLLLRIREFYTACHLARSEKLSTREATQRIQVIEKDLNQLLADIVRASRGA